MPIHVLRPSPRPTSSRLTGTLKVTLGVVGMLALAGCAGEDITRTFGLTRDAPDEFQVTTRAPLSMPPDFAIRPPRPGAARPQEQSSSSAAEAALVPQSSLANDSGAARTSAGQEALVGAAGPAAPADIRRKVEQEASLDQPDRTLTDRLMFWKSTPPPGIVVDPNREAQRLRENSALGQNIEQGDTPIIQRDAPKSGFLSKIF